MLYAAFAEVSLCFELGRATVVVNEDQLSLAIGKRGQNVRLAARLTGWDVDILTPVEFQNGVQRLDATLKGIEGFPHDQVDKVIALGLIDVRDIEEVGAGPLMEELSLTEEVAQKVVTRCAEEAKIVATETEAKKQGREVKVARFPWAASGRAYTVGRTEGLTKVIVDPETDEWPGTVGLDVADSIATTIVDVHTARR